MVQSPLAMSRHSSSRRTIGRIAFVVVLLVAFVPAPATADVRGRPNFEVFASDNRLEPGTETTIGLTLVNDASVYETSAVNPGLTDVVTTARAVQVSIRAADAPIEIKTDTRGVGNVPEGATPPIEFRVVVDDDAEPGRYRIPVTVRYTYTRFLGEADGTGREGVRYDVGTEQRFTVSVVVEPRATFSLRAVRSNVSVGTSGTFTLALHNDGAAPARNAQVQITSENPALTLGAGAAPTTSYVDTWEAGGTERFTVRATVDPDAVQRSYALSAIVTYDDPDGLRRTAEPVPFGLVPEAEGAFRIDAARSDLRVGETGSLNGTIRNTGGTVARNAVLVVQSVGRTVTTTEREVALGTLRPGQQADFAYEFDVSDEADPGSRRFSFVVQYREADGSTLTSDPLDVRLSIAEKRDIFEILDVSRSYRAGGSGSFRIRVRNAGEQPVTAVSAKLFADDPLSATDDEAFVDRLAPGETTNLTFGLSVDSGALGKTYPVSLDFQYDDATGDTLLSDTYRVPIVVTREPGSGLLSRLGTGVVALAAVVAVVFVGAIVLLVRRRGR